MFKHLAEIYASNHLTMHKGNLCQEDNFKGINTIHTQALSVWSISIWAMDLH